MLHIIANDYFLTQFLLSSIDSSDNQIKVIIHPKTRRIKKFSSARKLVNAYTGMDLLEFFPADYLDSLNRIAAEDDVLIFGIENVKELTIIHRHICSKNISLFTWNPVQDFDQNRFFRRLHIRALKKLAHTIYTFDPADAARHQLRLIDQVYRNVDTYIAPCDAIYDAYFVGQDKNRIQAILNLKNHFDAQGLRYKLHILPDRKKDYSEFEKTVLSSAAVNYTENIRLIQESKCLIDIPQKNQSGLTIRAMEAFFFRKKLITGNPFIKDSPLYSPEQVFIIGIDDMKGLKEFVNSAFQPEISYLKNHEFRYWALKNFSKINTTTSHPQ